MEELFSAPANLSGASDALRQRVLANIAESRAARLSQGGIDEVASLKSIRRYTERLVNGSAVSSDPAIMRQVRAINRRIDLEQYGAAASRYHALNFRLIRDAQASGFFRSLNVDRQIAIPSGGTLATRRPDYRFMPGDIYDLKTFRPGANAYDTASQFQDIQRATGQLPIPLYYRLW